MMRSRLPAYRRPGVMLNYGWAILLMVLCFGVAAI